MTKPLKIEISGGDVFTNTVMFGIIQQTVQDHGFSNVETIHELGDASARTDTMPSLLEVLHTTHPSIFSQPVTIKQNLKNATSGAPEEDLAYPTALVNELIYGQQFLPQRETTAFTDKAVVEAINNMQLV